LPGYREVMNAAVAPRDFERVAQAIRYLDEHREEQPGLDEVAGAIGLSPFHFQRLFRRWAGISPKRFLQVLTAEHAKTMLRDSASLLDTSLETGLSGPGRLHDVFVALEAMTPGDYKAEGAGLDIEFGAAATPFGTALIARTQRGVCGLEFLEPEEDAGPGEAALRRRWPGARWLRRDATAREVASRIFVRKSAPEPLTLLVRGTNFQVQVWRALLRVPPGRVVAYGDLARGVGNPGASRAVGAAVASNPVAYLIPCHRVIRSTGAVGGYRWGTERKLAMLAWEDACAAAV